MLFDVGIVYLNKVIMYIQGNVDCQTFFPNDETGTCILLLTDLEHWSEVHVKAVYMGSNPFLVYHCNFNIKSKGVSKRSHPLIPTQ